MVVYITFSALKETNHIDDIVDDNITENQSQSNVVGIKTYHRLSKEFVNEMLSGKATMYW